MVPTSYQHIVILNDGTHLCTCLLLVSKGIVCRHYFKLMIENPNALFHLMLMPMRWLKDEVWNCIDLISKEPYIGTSSKNLNQTNDGIAQITNFIPKHYDNIQEVQVHQHTQKKIEYGRIMGHFKRALNYSLEDNDQNNLDSIILTYISEKEAKLNAKAQSERNTLLNENINLDNRMKLSDGRIYDIDDINDPIKHQGKGRPAGKRLKAYNEKTGSSKIQKENKREQDLDNANNDDNINVRKCSLCHKTGHYAPKCPNKNNF